MLVIVMVVLLLAVTLAAAALAATLSSRTLTERSAHERAAQQAAEAGIQQQLYTQSENSIGDPASSYDLNGGVLNTAHLLDCIEPTLGVSLSVTGLAAVNVNSAGVCPVSTANPTGSTGATGVTGIPIGNKAYEESEYIPGAKLPLSGGSEVDLAPKIVSLGWQGSALSSASGNVFSREEAILAPISPLPVVGANGTATLSGLSLLGIPLAMVVDGDLAASTAMNLSLVTLGVNTTLSNGLLAVFKCGCSAPSGIPVAQFVHTTVPNRQPINVASTKLPCPSSTSEANCPDISSTFWNSATDTVTVGASKTLTLSGGDYVFCNFSASGTNAHVVANPSANSPVRIFIDSPTSARCKGNTPTPTQTATSASFTNKPCSLSSCNAKFWTEGNFLAANGITNNEGVTTPSGLQIYVVGDQQSPPFDDNTYVQIGTQPTGLLQATNVVTESAIVYAPTSDVLMTTATCAVLTCTGGTFEGNLIGTDVTATALTFIQDLDLSNDPLYNGLNAFQVQQEVQCSPNPNSGGTNYTALTQNATTDTNGC